MAAGQFFNWRFLSGPGWTRSHPYSLSAAPTDDTLRITVKDLGDGSHALADLKPGTRVVIEGPYGRLHAGVRTRQKVTLMASGIGISPLRALLDDLPAAPRRRDPALPRPQPGRPGAAYGDRGDRRSHRRTRVLPRGTQAAGALVLAAGGGGAR